MKILNIEFIVFITPETKSGHDWMQFITLDGFQQNMILPQCERLITQFLNFFF